jgi:hypothetical protein
MQPMAGGGRPGAVLGQGDHALGFIAQGLGPGFGGGDATFANQLGGQAPQQGFALVGGASQHGDSALVAHGSGARNGSGGDGAQSGSKRTMRQELVK